MCRLQKGETYHEDRNRLLGTATLRYDITDWLYAQGRFNYDRGNSLTESNSVNAKGAATLKNSDGTYRGSYSITQSVSTDINADFLVGGNKEFGKFSVDASFGGNTLRSQFLSMNQNSSNFTAPDFYSIENGTVKNQGNPVFNRSRINSLYGLAEFGYNRIVIPEFYG